VREDFVTVSEAKIGIHKIIAGLGDRAAVLLLRHGKPVAALLDYSRYVGLLNRIEELEDQLAVIDAQRDVSAGMTVGWEKVKAEAGLLGEEVPEAATKDDGRSSAKTGDARGVRD
jgi:PHD/YefM family antitoxin component YafN of YafNO toxin-antitoxin module